MADATAQAKQQVDQSNKEKQKIVAEAYGHQGKPTPTQEENDLARLGVPFEKHEDDGSGPSPEFRLTVERQSEANKPSGGSGGYMTRGTSAKENREAPTREHASAQPKTS